MNIGSVANSNRQTTSSQQGNQSPTQHGTSLEFFPPEVAREIRSYLNETADKKNIRG
jgi:hypothetical protein